MVGSRRGRAAAAAKPAPKPATRRGRQSYSTTYHQCSGASSTALAETVLKFIIKNMKNV